MKAERSLNCFCFLSDILIVFLAVVCFFSFTETGIAKEKAVRQSTGAVKQSGLVRPEWVRSGDSESAVLKEHAGDGNVKLSEFEIEFDHPSFKKVLHEDKASHKTFEYDSININGLPMYGKAPGEPVLPANPVYFLLPFNSEVLNITVFKGTRTFVEGEYFIEPAQEPVPVSQIDNAKNTLPNKIIYGCVGPYPLTVCGNEVRFVKKGGYTILVFYLNPVEYYPMSRKIAYFRNMRIKVVTAPDQAPDMKNTANEIRINPKASDFIASYLINPEDIETYKGGYSETAPVSTGDNLPGPGPYDYVIITSNALQAMFQPLINLKTDSGINAAIVTSEYIEENYNGIETGDKPDKIREFIRDAYNNWHTQWILLGGDIEIIPERGVYASASVYVDYHLPTDMYYACLDGPWNADGDEIWGEKNDGADGADIDLMPDLFIGRAPVSDLAEADNFVAKTVLYGTSKHPNNQTFILLGEKLWADVYGSASCLIIKKGCLPGSWDIVERYDDAGNGWSGQDFIKDLNASCHLVYHIGHSNRTSNAKLYNSDVASLVNEYPYFMYSVGCYSGAFDYNDCIAEKHVVSTHGAFGVVMNSRYGWGSATNIEEYSHRYAYEFWDAIFNENITQLGQANHDSKVDNLWRVLGTGVYRWIHFETNLLADPETDVYIEIGGRTKPNGKDNPNRKNTPNGKNKSDTSSGIEITRLSASSGTIGSEIKISGKNFGVLNAANRVNFYGGNGSKDASIKQWKNSFIECSVPQIQTGEYKLKVITASEESNAVSFKVLAN